MDLRQNAAKMRQVPGQNPGQSANKAENAAGPPVNPWTCGKMRQKKLIDKSHFRKRISPKNHIFGKPMYYFVRIFAFGSII